ncbi:helix-turn-helix transcriptional regulator [Dyadobacter flavalbus]|uniref:Helix-turn-helix transcriptional regulator n=1 Tax=Dyadobacter flavalbus TaxID=2579942 RepID=A0A5M8QPB4_9BACT|nr:helix-turn-helix transcriptional regulator [Dyadobacter flavalbus]KAA6437081.1 helix-turn-helix transcriptional regulator [Dyadobacter flavalbus]
MSNKEDFYTKIQHLISDEPSDWLEDEKFQEENKEWLHHSQQVALQVLRQLRKIGMSQNELALKMNVSRQQVNRWLKGSENFTFATVDKLRKAVGINLMSTDLNSVESKPTEIRGASEAVILMGTIIYAAMLRERYEISQPIASSNYEELHEVNNGRIMQLYPNIKLLQSQ